MDTDKERRFKECEGNERTVIVVDAATKVKLLRMEKVWYVINPNFGALVHGYLFCCFGGSIFCLGRTHCFLS